MHIAVKMPYWSNECLHLFLNSRQLFHHLSKLVVRQVGTMFISNEQAFLTMGGWTKFTIQGLPSKSGRSLVILFTHGLKLRKWVVFHSYHVLGWLLDNSDLILRGLTRNNSCQEKKWSCKENRVRKVVNTGTEEHSVVKKSGMTDPSSINSDTLTGRG